MFSLKQQVVSSSYVLSCLHYTPLNCQSLESASSVCGSLLGLTGRKLFSQVLEQRVFLHTTAINPTLAGEILASFTDQNSLLRGRQGCEIISHLTNSKQQRCSAAAVKATSRRYRKHPILVNTTSHGALRSCLV